LILANRNNSEAISSIINLTRDSSSLVRSCALGALGFLKATKASKVIHSCLSDINLEVKKSALKAVIDIGDKIPPEEINKISTEKDDELEKLLLLARKN
jgi:HEAT repeat protein